MLGVQYYIHIIIPVYISETMDNSSEMATPKVNYFGSVDFTKVAV